MKKEKELCMVCFEPITEDDEYEGVCDYCMYPLLNEE